MSAPQTVTPRHLRNLLAASPDCFLGLVEGEVRVVDGGDDEGALEIVSAADLRDRVGDDPDDHVLEDEAESLTVATQQRGG
ncbi:MULTISPECIES: hypothetical protein [unclassified Aeromicrobium]|uniref:hypothetical protein n=1 Tax=unclassified Aeromicrobium TaxID=2633570 RepID=UPI002096FA3B|nr:MULTISPECIES: hypothetical protein [unclassified Aeromicrobium]MCO7240182.1 hypothetical protein [Aeromicrobium sp. CnD17-E]MDR6118602.1 hypothetical protein [Aeromicrobium sp. SORGH_AS_0981]